MATVRVGNRDIDVDTSPIQAASANFRTATFVELREGCLVLRPSGGMRLFASLFLLLGLIIISVAAAIFIGGERGWVVPGLAAFGAIFAAAGLGMLLMPRRNEFDRDAGQWTVSRFMSSTARPLTDILAIQLINGGYHTSGDGPGYNTYQLNLILDDSAEPRRCLSNHANRDATRTDGMWLAEFLGVPLLNQM